MAERLSYYEQFSSPTHNEVLQPEHDDIEAEQREKILKGYELDADGDIIVYGYMLLGEAHGAEQSSSFIEFNPIFPTSEFHLDTESAEYQQLTKHAAAYDMQPPLNQEDLPRFIYECITDKGQTGEADDIWIPIDEATADSYLLYRPDDFNNFMQSAKPPKNADGCCSIDNSEGEHHHYHGSWQGNNKGKMLLSFALLGHQRSIDVIQLLAQETNAKQYEELGGKRLSELSEKELLFALSDLVIERKSKELKEKINLDAEGRYERIVTNLIGLILQKDTSNTELKNQLEKVISHKFTGWVSFDEKPSDLAEGLNQQHSEMLKDQLKAQRVKLPSLDSTEIISTLQKLHANTFTPEQINVFFAQLEDIEVVEDDGLSLSHAEIVAVLSAELEIITRPDFENIELTQQEQKILQIAELLHKQKYWFVHFEDAGDNHGEGYHGNIKVGEDGGVEIDLCPEHTPTLDGQLEQAAQAAQQAIEEAIKEAETQKNVNIISEFLPGGFYLAEQPATTSGGTKKSLKDLEVPSQKTSGGSKSEIYFPKIELNLNFGFGKNNQPKTQKRTRTSHKYFSSPSAIAFQEKQEQYPKHKNPKLTQNPHGIYESSSSPLVVSSVQLEQSIPIIKQLKNSSKPKEKNVVPEKKTPFGTAPFGFTPDVVNILRSAHKPIRKSPKQKLQLKSAINSQKDQMSHSSFVAQPINFQLSPTISQNTQKNTEKNIVKLSKKSKSISVSIDAVVVEEHTVKHEPDSKNPESPQTHPQTFDLQQTANVQQQVQIQEVREVEQRIEEIFEQKQQAAEEEAFQEAMQEITKENQEEAQNETRQEKAEETKQIVEVENTVEIPQEVASTEEIKQEPSRTISKKQRTRKQTIRESSPDNPQQPSNNPAPKQKTKQRTQTTPAQEKEVEPIKKQSTQSESVTLALSTDGKTVFDPLNRFVASKMVSQAFQNYLKNNGEEYDRKQKIKVKIKPLNPRKTPQKITDEDFQLFMQKYGSKMKKYVMTGWKRMKIDGKRRLVFMLVTADDAKDVRKKFKNAEVVGEDEWIVG